ncbi:MAG: hypothetical protein AB8G99_26140 [Planctomycetaceae bacterium]
MKWLLAQTGTFTTTEWDVPESLPMLLAWGVGIALLFAFVIFTYKRDTARLGSGWRAWLTLLRLAALVGVIGILLNPHERTQRSSMRPSEVAVVIDTSISMQFPAKDSDSSSSDVASRAEAVRTAILESSLLDELSEKHNVNVFTFDSMLAGPHRSISKAGGDDSIPDDFSDAEWTELLQPRGLETRMGESLQELIGRVASPTLSGVVVVSDGGANAGLDVAVANQKARSSQARLIAVGVGSTRQPTNIAIANVQSPTEVHIGDPFEIGVFVQGQGVAGQTVDVELLARSEDSDSDPVLVEKKSVELTEDGVPAEVKFQQKPASPGGIEYEVRVAAEDQLTELSLTDNSRRRTVNVSERQIRVLLISGGPSRDYRFVRDMLFRHTGMELDVWLQTVDTVSAPGVSQEAAKVLTEFPLTRAELFEYDAVLAFDIDWSRLTPPGLSLFQEWMSERAGGMVFVSGRIHTPAVASTDELKPVRDVLPVRLSPFLLDAGLTRGNTQPWPVELTEDGRGASFLQLAESATDADPWEQFSGIHRSYPTDGVKDGGTVLAYFANPKAQTKNGKPILMATQFFGSGRCLFLGSGEMWRLRLTSAENFNRFWTKAIRDVAQGRIKSGSSRGLLMLDRTEFVLGQSVRVRAQLYDASLNALEAESVPVTILDPNGKPLLPERVLLKDKTRAGQYVGSFRAGRQGAWEISLQIPESRETLSQKVEVLLPNLESDNPAQNVKLLEQLVADTGGSYLTLDDVKTQLLDLLPDRSESVMIDERLKPLWDRQWVLWAIVGVLGVEWLTRKLLKLA